MTSKAEDREFATEISRKVFEQLGNPKSLQVTCDKLASVLAIAFDNYRDYLQKISAVETPTTPFPMLVKLASDGSYRVLHEIPNGIAFKVAAKNLKLEDAQSAELSNSRDKTI